MYKKNAQTEMVELDLKKLFVDYLQHWWIIILCGVVATAAILGYCWNFVTPKYRAGVTIYVNNIRAGETINYISGSNLEASQQLVNTYVSIMRSDTVLSHVSEIHGLSYTPKQLRSIMSAQQTQDTQMFSLYVTHPDPETAATVANAVADVALAEIEKIVEGSSAKIVDYAQVPQSLHSPNYTKSAVAGFLVGCLLSVGFLTVRFLVDVRIKTAEELECLFDIPIIGQIPDFINPDERIRLGGYGNTPSAKHERKDG